MQAHHRSNSSHFKTANLTEFMANYQFAMHNGAKKHSYEYVLATNLDIGTSFVKLYALLNAPLGEVDVVEVHVPIASVICIYDEV